MLFAEIKKVELEYKFHESFPDLNVEDTLAQVMPKGVARKIKTPAGLPAYLQALYEYPLLTKGQEQYLFRRMNFLFYFCDTQRPTDGRATLRVRFWNRCYDEAMEARQLILKSNLRIAVHFAKLFSGGDLEQFDEYVSDGNMALFRAVRGFDFSKGFKFSTYAFWAVQKQLARSRNLRRRQAARFPTLEPFYEVDMGDWTYVGTADVSDLLLSREIPQEEQAVTIEEAAGIPALFNVLTDIEKFIIEHRFGLNGKDQLTLKATGEFMCLSKERVRQIETRALHKMRNADERRREEAGRTQEPVSTGRLRETAGRNEGPSEVRRRLLA